MGALDGRVAVVTGGGSGLGRAYATAFAAEGARVVVGSTPGSGGAPATAEAVVAEIRAGGGEAVAHTRSVVTWDDGAAVVDAALDAYGALDVVVNNAGVLRDKLLVNLAEDDWDAVVDVHLKGYAALLHHAGGYWRTCHKEDRPRQGAVVNMTAGGALFGNAGQTPYSAAKAGVIALTFNAARELDRYGVRVNAVAPFARTRTTSATPSMAEMLKVPDDPATFDPYDPANVAPLVTYLATASCPLTGKVFDAMGGRVLLYEGWRVAARFERDRRWTVDELAAELDGLPSGPPGPPATS